MSQKINKLQAPDGVIYEIEDASAQSEITSLKAKVPVINLNGQITDSTGGIEIDFEEANYEQFLLNKTASIQIRHGSDNFRIFHLEYIEDCGGGNYYCYYVSGEYRLYIDWYPNNESYIDDSYIEPVAQILIWEAGD